MASVKNLKKDIDYLVNEVIWDCSLYMQFNASPKKEEVEAILTKAVDLRNNLYERANHPDGKDNPKLVKVHYRNIGSDLLSGINDLFKQISILAKS